MAFAPTFLKEIQVTIRKVTSWQLPSFSKKGFSTDKNWEPLAYVCHTDTDFLLFVKIKLDKSLIFWYTI